MKKLVILLAVVSSGSALAGFGRAGCGLGSLVFTGDDNQILAATTNGTSGSQTFGITSGTSNCVDAPEKTALIPFIDKNKVQLANDVARGSGESLAGLGSLMGCAQQDVFNTHLQADYAQIFVSGASAEEITDHVISSVGRNPGLRDSCRILM